MRTKFEVEEPSDITMTLTVTMKLGEWKTLQSQLADKYPSWKLSAAITDMVLLATKTFYPDENLDPI